MIKYKTQGICAKEIYFSVKDNILQEVIFVGGCDGNHKGLCALVEGLPIDEVIGEIIDIELDERALSIFDVGEEHVFQRNRIARGHHLFAQANSLAVAVIDDDLALTVHSDIHFLKPVKAGQRVVSKAVVTGKDNEKNRTFVTVTSTVDGNTVFTGQFEMYRTKGKGEK